MSHVEKLTALGEAWAPVVAVVGSVLSALLHRTRRRKRDAALRSIVGAEVRAAVSDEIRVALRPVVVRLERLERDRGKQAPNRLTAG